MVTLTLWEIAVFAVVVQGYVSMMMQAESKLMTKASAMEVAVVATGTNITSINVAHTLEPWTLTLIAVLVEEELKRSGEAIRVEEMHTTNLHVLTLTMVFLTQMVMIAPTIQPITCMTQLLILSVMEH